jgi:hypothetical protein
MIPLTAAFIGALVIAVRTSSDISPKSNSSRKSLAKKSCVPSKPPPDEDPPSARNGEVGSRIILEPAASKSRNAFTPPSG